MFQRLRQRVPRFKRHLVTSCSWDFSGTKTAAVLAPAEGRVSSIWLPPPNDSKSDLDKETGAVLILKLC
jgi:hypothetical protein